MEKVEMETRTEMVKEIARIRMMKVKDLPITLA
jgi:hypothetical protein